jgi:hypothetical protein
MSSQILLRGLRRRGLMLSLPDNRRDYCGQRRGRNGAVLAAQRMRKFQLLMLIRMEECSKVEQGWRRLVEASRRGLNNQVELESGLDHSHKPTTCECQEVGASERLPQMLYGATVGTGKRRRPDEHLFP